MEMTLTERQEDELAALVANGEFASPQEALRHLVDEALELRAWGDEAWAKPLVDEAMAQIERGEVVTSEEHRTRIDALLAGFRPA